MLLRGEDIDFGRAHAVVSAAQKFIVPVCPWEDADRLVYPPNSELSGQPVMDWQGRQVGETGIVFFNARDQCYQAARADGRSVVVVNEVSSEQAAAIIDFARRLGEKPNRLSKGALSRLLEFAVQRLGLIDVYNSDDEYVRSNMVPMVLAGPGEHCRPVGWMRRRDLTASLAVFVKGPAAFAGPALTAQQIPAEGAFVIRYAEAYRMVEASVFLRTYMRPDAAPLALSDFLEAGL